MELKDLRKFRMDERVLHHHRQETWTFNFQDAWICFQKITVKATV